MRKNSIKNDLIIYFLAEKNICLIKTGDATRKKSNVLTPSIVSALTESVFEATIDAYNRLPPEENRQFKILASHNTARIYFEYFEYNDFTEAFKRPYSEIYVTYHEQSDALCARGCSEKFLDLSVSFLKRRAKDEFPNSRRIWDMNCHRYGSDGKKQMSRSRMDKINAKILNAMQTDKILENESNVYII